MILNFQVMQELRKMTSKIPDEDDIIPDLDPASEYEKIGEKK